MTRETKNTLGEYFNSEIWGNYLGAVIGVGTFVFLALLFVCFDPGRNLPQYGVGWFFAGLGAYVGLSGSIPVLSFKLHKLRLRLNKKVQDNQPVTYLQSCLRVSDACVKLLDDSLMSAQISSVAKDINKYGVILLNKAKVIRSVAEVCSNSGTKANLLKMADKQTQMAYSIADKFQALIPSILADQTANGMSELEADLENIKSIIERTNREVQTVTTMNNGVRREYDSYRSSY